jgi:tetratricopeptide (TPR) repeat protein
MTDRLEEKILFSWIHLADIQAGQADAGRRWDQALVLDALRADIAAWRSWGLPAPGAVFVTGDIAFSGGARDPNEYATARAWLREVAGSVGLGPDRVYVVPGNHDVDRDADQDRDTRRLVQSLRNGAESLDDALHEAGDRRRLAARLGNYLAFAEGFAPACLGTRAEGEDGLFWAHRFDALGGLRVRLLGLDTALLAADDADHGKLRIGTEQIARSISNPSIERYGEIVIALSHHALHRGWLADEKEAAGWLRTYAHVHLHGQVREAESEAARSGAGGGLVRVAAGGGASHGYSFAAVVASESRVTLRIWPRVWSEKNKRYLVDVDNVPDGRAFAEHALRVELRPSTNEPVEMRAPLPSGALFEGPGAMPAVRVPHFRGRSAEMDALRRALGQEVGAVCVVASGIGGIGKTTLVRELVATEARALFPEGAAWIDATSLPSELGRIAQRFGWKRERLPTVEEANQWLATALYDRAVLLVVDNADADQAKEIPVPGGKCRTLVTSRALMLHEDLGKPSLPLPLGKWSDKTCREYLREVSTHTDLSDDALDRLARFVDDLPLAVRLIAKLLVRGTAPEKLLAQLEEEPVETLDAVARGADRGVKATFLLAYRERNEMEQRVLLATSACARATRAEVVAKVAGVSEAQAERVLTDLWEQRSLVEHDASAERPWGLHDVVRMFLREQEGAGDAAERHVAFVKAHLEAHKELTDWEAVEREMPEVTEAIERALREERLNDAKLVYHVLSLWGRTGRNTIARRILMSLTQADPPDSHELAMTLSCLGSVEHALGRSERAIEYFEQVDRIYRASSLSQKLAETSLNLAGVYLAQGNISLAMRYVDRSFTVTAALGVPETPAALAARGSCYLHVGRYGEAIRDLRRALDLLIERENLTDQAMCWNNLGACYSHLRQYDLAILYYQKMVANDEKLGNLLGQLGGTRNIAAEYWNVGNVAASVEHLRRALKINERLGLADNHPYIREIREHLAMALMPRERRPGETMNQTPSAFYISKVTVEKIRSVGAAEWSVRPGPGWHVIVGDNAAGKSTLLRAMGLVLVGHEEAAALRQGWGTWVQGDAAEGRMEVTLVRPAFRSIPVGVNGAVPDVSLQLRLRLNRSTLTDEALIDRGIWNSVQGSFSAAYGPFRRFTDSDMTYERTLATQPRLTRHISLFDSSVALTESLAWLRDLDYKRLDHKPEGKLLEPFKALANDPGPPFFLPQGARLSEISSSGITIKDGNGFDIPIEDLSDGYRAVLSLTFDLIRHMANAFGYDHVFDPADPTVVLPGGIVLIDEIDVHLHPTWQRTIGLWFKKHFPNVQFIVTTHSPLVCQTADSVFYLPAPGSDDEPRMLDQGELDRLRYGNVLDAYGTGVFGYGVTRSEESKNMRRRLVELNRKEADIGLTPEEHAEQARLRAVMPSAAPTLNGDSREGGA